ncbi:eukaryotic translation initiation factor 3 subunit D-like [Uranotaenia lowii]|uniref:eukaryotic translation initiation factor 3 subunit D-like n=1 Tax=Uranotaenia lowii TaxID=190385 RepID=UPI00247A7545|nr:eukaryotic translation initiation factor 3 subunit D-like [Uranotaenia lowii]
MCPNKLREITRELFPHHDINSWPQVPYDWDTSEEELISLEELRDIAKSLQLEKAPGPDGIPNIAVKAAIMEFPEMFRSSLQICIEERMFPDIWKRQKLVLLPKPGKPLENPSAYRPICLLDTVGKILEKVIFNRIYRYTEGEGGLFNNQFGFRKGRCTVDAIRTAIETADKARLKKRRGNRFCAVVTLDVRNAFNSVSWAAIASSLIKMRIPKYLCKLVEIYFQNRKLLYMTSEGFQEMDVTAGVPQRLPNIKDGEDILTCGTLEYYDKTNDRVNVKNERALQRVDRIFHTVTTTDDPIIRQLSKTHGNVYATDAILATIMCCTRSNYSWDIVIEKIGDKLFMDKRDNTEFDLLTVNETAIEPPQEDGNSLNSPRNLAIEATFINHNFSQQVLKSGAAEAKFKFDEPNPFIGDDEDGEVASVAYRYRKWDLNNGIVLVARCEHDAVSQTPQGDTQFLTLKALNEWDSKLANGVEWRQKLDTQRGAVLANELRNNSCKLAKWTVQALLAGSDQIKFGYVSRAHIRDSSRHVILGTQQFKPHEFANQINLSMDNAWGILRCIIDICMKQKDGKYLIMKDPNKPMIRLYDIPDNTFETDGEEEEGDDGEAFQPYSYGSSAKPAAAVAAPVATKIEAEPTAVPLPTTAAAAVASAAPTTAAGAVAAQK